MDTGQLYIVATPIGNLADITYHAVETLKKADLIFCEDTRVTKKLLDHYGIIAETRSFYGRGSKTRKPEPKSEYVIGELKAGKNIAFVTDAGTPGISDPGNQLVEAAVRAGIRVIPTPGVSSLTTLISVAGVDMGKFVFLGFPPHKKGRQSFMKSVIENKLPVVLFESRHRIMRLVADLASMADLADSGGFGGEGLGGVSMRLIIGRELTKTFEEIIRGNAESILSYLKTDENRQKGEFVVIIYKEK